MVARATLDEIQIKTFSDTVALGCTNIVEDRVPYICGRTQEAVIGHGKRAQSRIYGSERAIYGSERPIISRSQTPFRQKLARRKGF